ncbi:SAM-dependent methyltransferase [Ignavibacterium album JCM 16511]|uniref:SAM-dependent methyltransferase n=1 Tax=Ignavibacterium album (strain DSM 19864 / JCM 16511 / NBRC 101810 / Mat9-16) TaxID=945713 RepID=I0AIM7_IGNAJ|nr:class I SAM-dependent methyltransferase [Ignavibacterium album]AFH48834.1 SAM-dependent methyltransferase [Ignavibacterium album JCM 16511]
MKQNKTHWYDGWFYDKFIAPNQDRLFSLIKNLVEPNSTILDVGCGTGRFSFTIADKSKSVLGIDLSSRNIEKAKSNLAKNPNGKISFLHSDISKLIMNNHHFDYAVMTYVIHEVNEEERIKLLKDISSVADKIIIGDYLVPKPNEFWSTLIEVVEFVAGSEHYRNYKNYVRNGGLKDLANKAGLKIIKEIKNKPSTSHLVVLTK